MHPGVSAIAEECERFFKIRKTYDLGAEDDVLGWWKVSRVLYIMYSLILTQVPDKPEVLSRHCSDGPRYTSHLSYEHLCRAVVLEITSLM